MYKHILFLLILLEVGLIVYVLIRSHRIPKERLNIILPRHHSQMRNPIDIPVVYINCDKDVDRRAWIESQGVKYGFNPIRVPGVIVNQKIVPRKQYTIGGVSFIIQDRVDLSPSELGCTLAHIKALQFVSQLDTDYALIVEDDCSFELTDFLGRTLRQIADEVKGDWDLLKVSSNELDYELVIEPHSDARSNTAYIVKRTTFRPGDIISLHGNKESDVFIHRRHRTLQLSLPIFAPDNRYLKSTIHDDHTPGHIDMAHGVYKAWTKRYLK